MDRNERVLKAMIVDDDMEAINYLAEFIGVTDNLELVVKTNNPKKALSILKTVAIDVLFLDMEMPMLNGMQFMAQLKRLRETNISLSNMQVVVCSAYEHFAVQSFAYKVADYLIKPFFFDRYIEAVDEVKKRVLPLDVNLVSSDNECFLIHSERGKNVHRVPFSAIKYVEASEQKTRLWVSDAKYYEVQLVLKKVLLLLPQSQFVKVHRSYAISMAHFDERIGKTIVLAGVQERIPMGESGKYPLFETWLADNALKGKPVVKNVRSE